MMMMMGSSLPEDVVLKVKEGLLRQRELEINRYSTCTTVLPAVR